MTTKDGVPKLVADVIKSVTYPGQRVSQSVIRQAYSIARKQAIIDTMQWKQKYITIEETL